LKYIKKELQKIIKQDKLLCVKSICDSSKWKGIQFLEDLIDDLCKTLIHIINQERQNEIPTFIKEETEENLVSWLTLHNSNLNFPSEYNGLFYFFIDKIFTLVEAPSESVSKKAWTRTEIKEFYKKIESIKLKKEVSSTDDVFQYFSGKSFDFNLSQKIQDIVTNCIDLYNSGRLNQRMFSMICKKFKMKHEEEIFTLDSEDKEQLSLAFDRLAETLQLKNHVLK